ncbi:MAG: hypothetical protein Q9180_001074, partial [Flavoplaca navasiana]
TARFSSNILNEKVSLPRQSITDTYAHVNLTWSSVGTAVTVKDASINKHRGLLRLLKAVVHLLCLFWACFA